jgi:hypothetical protein
MVYKRLIIYKDIEADNQVPLLHSEKLEVSTVADVMAANEDFSVARPATPKQTGM